MLAPFTCTLEPPWHPWCLTWNGSTLWIQTGTVSCRRNFSMTWTWPRSDFFSLSSPFYFEKVGHGLFTLSCYCGKTSRLICRLRTFVLTWCLWMCLSGIIWFHNPKTAYRWKALCCSNTHKQLFWIHPYYPNKKTWSGKKTTRLAVHILH